MRQRQARAAARLRSRLDPKDARVAMPKAARRPTPLILEVAMTSDRPGIRYTLRTTEFEHLSLMVNSAQAKFANALSGDQNSLEEAVTSLFKALSYAVELLAEQETESGS
jgi:hypothetical protein